MKNKGQQRPLDLIVNDQNVSRDFTSFNELI